MKTKRFYEQDDQQEPTHIYDVLRLIQRRPGIDTPAVCLEVFSVDIVRSDMKGSELAAFLSNWYTDQWEEICKCVDLLWERGQITFSDDGELRATI
jgi:hypothetical protein